MDSCVSRNDNNRWKEGNVNVKQIYQSGIFTSLKNKIYNNRKSKLCSLGGINSVKQWRFEVFNQPGFADVRGKGVLEDIKELGISSVQAVQSATVFLIEAGFDKDFAKRVAQELLIDPVCEEYYIGRSKAPAGLAKATLIEVHLKSGVTDPVAESVMAALTDMGVKANNVRTARKYILLGDIKIVKEIGVT